MAVGDHSPIALILDKHRGTDEGLHDNINPLMFSGYQTSNYKFKNF
jgi:hypothetical protein